MRRSGGRVGTAVLLAIAGLGIGPAGAGAQAVNRFGVPVVMRDGVRLVANVWIPSGSGRFPAILLRTPYDKTAQFARYRLVNYLKAGYAVVVQDTRGRGDSDGTFDFYFPEGRDGFDTIEWIARQPWSNGRVGTDGGSYLGTVQWLAARERPPHLACMIPTASSGRLFDELPYQGGAFKLEWSLPWLNSTAGRVSQGDLNQLVHWDSLAMQRPLVRLDSLMGRPMPLYQQFLAHSTLDGYWKRIHFTDRDFSAITIPTLTFTGWFDGDQSGALSYWDGLSRRNGGADDHFLVVGPWTHAQTYLGGALKVGGFEFDSVAILRTQEIRIRFFDWCLKQSSPRFDQPRVRAYVMGSNRWIEGDRYPVPGAEIRPYYLRSGGRANTLDGDGALSVEAPGADPADHFEYDPRRPVPSGEPATDQRDIERRSDVLVYTTPVLDAPVEVLGRVFVELDIASDALDTDFTAKLVDVFPDGRAVLLGPVPAGVIRARYRNGYQRTELLVPGQPARVRIELFDVGHSFLPGHRIRLEISSSAFPYIDANPNTGRPIATETASQVARQTVFHDAGRPSRLLLPVIPAIR